jgi:hypothetical protein
VCDGRRLGAEPPTPLSSARGEFRNTKNGNQKREDKKTRRQKGAREANYGTLKTAIKNGQTKGGAGMEFQNTKKETERQKKAIRHCKACFLLSFFFFVFLNQDKKAENRVKKDNEVPQKSR